MKGEYVGKFKVRELVIFISRRITSSIEKRVWEKRQQVCKSSEI